MRVSNGEVKEASVTGQSVNASVNRCFRTGKQHQNPDVNWEAGGSKIRDQLFEGSAAIHPEQPLQPA
jgi:hypothetical protein